MTYKAKKILWIVLTAVFAVFMCALIAGTCVARYYYVIVDRYLNCKRTEVEYYDENGNKVENAGTRPESSSANSTRKPRA